MQKKYLNAIASTAVLVSMILPAVIFAQGRPPERNATGTNAAGANFCSALVKRLDNLESKASEQLSNLISRKTDRESQLQGRWDKYMSDESARDAETKARFDGDIGKLNERVSSGTAAQKAAVSAFEVAVKSALDARRAAVAAALKTFHEGVVSALKAREDSVARAFTSRIDALKAAAAKAKADCASGVSAQTVRRDFVAAMRAAQTKFVSTKKADNDFNAAMKSLTAAKKAAFEKAQSDFRAALEAAKSALKAALAESSGATSTNQ